VSAVSHGSYVHLEALAGIGALAGSYAVAARNEVVPRWRLACLASACALLLVAHVGPLARLASTSLLSAHLLQNVILAEWAPALIVLAVPPGLGARLARLPGARVLTHPAVALPLWLATYVAWHVPAAYDLALRHQSTVLHTEHLCYFAAGVLFWWPVFQPAPHTLSPARKTVYLFAAFAVASPLGIVLSLLGRPIYDFYVEAANSWGLSDLADQQIAGITMATEEAIVFFCACAYFFVHFLAEEEDATVTESSQIA
jgi:cytochrome c oxidase assembly factor CtaG